APLSYQWSKGGTSISGATSPTYTTAATASSDNGAQFTVLVSNAAGSVGSSPATLTVNAAPPPTSTGRLAATVATRSAAAGYPANNAGDGNTSTQWVASLNGNDSNNNNAWIRLDYGPP